MKIRYYRKNSNKLKNIPLTLYVKQPNVIQTKLNQADIH